jgi:hypothetical protein
VKRLLCVVGYVGDKCHVDERKWCLSCFVGEFMELDRGWCFYPFQSVMLDCFIDGALDLPFFSKWVHQPEKKMVVSVAT